MFAVKLRSSTSRACTRAAAASCGSRSGLLPRRDDVERLTLQARHGLLVVVLAAVWLMLSATLFVAFLVWVAAHGATRGGLIAFPLVWLVLSGLLYRRTRVSRRRLQP